MVVVAQLVRAPRCGRGGRGFDPRRSPFKAPGQSDLAPDRQRANTPSTVLRCGKSSRIRPMTRLSELRTASIYRRKRDGRAQGRWKLEVRYGGQRPTISTWDTRREAQQEFARLRALSATVVIDGPKRPFIGYAAQWMAVQQQLGLADSTIERKRSTITMWLAPAHAPWGFAERRIGTITANDGQAALGTGGGELGQGGVELHDRCVPLGDQLPAPVLQQPDDSSHVLDSHLLQATVVGGGDGHGTGVMLVGLAARLARQRTGAGGQGGGDVDDGLAASQELLGEQVPQPRAGPTAYPYRTIRGTAEGRRQHPRA